ncbi:MAG: hypothetical protein AB1403_10600 [Candidatus Riflebacteria bacterium]
MTRMKKAFILMVVAVSLPLVAFCQPVSLNEKTLGAFYFDFARMYENYSTQVKELANPEKKGKLAEVNGQVARLLNKPNFDLSEQIAEFTSFEKDGLFKPSGAMWFAIDDKYRPALILPAAVQPKKLYDYIFAALGSPQQMMAAKSEADLVEIVFPTPEFKIIFKLATDSVSLTADQEVEKGSPVDFWKSLVERSGQKETMLALHIDFDVVKRLLARKRVDGRHSMCVGNMMAIKNAVEMFQIESGELMKDLDLPLLVQKRYLPEGSSCNEGGKYKINNEKNLEVVCSVHGTIEKPISTSSDAEDVDPRVKPFKAFKLEIDDEKILVKMQITDANLLEQWEAIGKQQILTLKHMLNNQIGNMPPEQKEKALQIADSIKCLKEEGWLVVSVTGITPQTLASSAMGAIEAIRQMALPKFKKAREIEMKKLENEGKE